jgi:hypothetical protein
MARNLTELLAEKNGMRISGEARRLIAHSSGESHGYIISNTRYTVINLFKIEEQKFVSAMEASHRRKTFEKGGTEGRGRKGGAL